MRRSLLDCKSHMGTHASTRTHIAYTRAHRFHSHVCTSTRSAPGIAQEDNLITPFPESEYGPGGELRLQDDGNLVLYSVDGRAKAVSNTAQ